MDTKYFGISDKILNDWLQDKEYITTSDEAEAVAMAMGYFLATGEIGTVFCSADGFMNCLNFLTSEVIPQKIAMNFVISYGRIELPHYVASQMLENLINELQIFEPTAISYQLIKR